VSAPFQKQSEATKGHKVARINTGLVSVVCIEGFLAAIPTDLVGKKLMTETIVDQRGRILIPEEIRESAGLTSGTMVAIEKAKDVVVIKPLRKHRRGWRQLCGLAPERTGKPEWPTTEEIKDIWR
jgi:AbrB family looped-hinge helix DNA binding protein